MLQFDTTISTEALKMDKYILNFQVFSGLEPISQIQDFDIQIAAN